MKTLVNMKKYINIDDFITVLMWIKTFFFIEGKKFKYQNLLDQAYTYKLSETPWNVDIHNIDDVIIDAFHIYQKLISTKDKVDMLLDSINNGLFDKKVFTSETENYERIFEDLLLNYKYQDLETCAIQKGFLSEKMNEYVQIEDYENAARIRDIIKMC